MKKYRYCSTLCLAAVSVLAACTQDTLTDGADTMPEGMYPLQIASVTMEVESSAETWGAKSPQTRVAENADRNSSVWQNGDKINVQIGNGTPGVYTYTDGRLEVADGDAPAYWASRNGNQTITAWHTSSGRETVDLSNQTSELAYVLTARETADFNQSVSLAFSHALAKIRVVLEGPDKDKVQDVMIKTLSSCTLNADGTLTAGNVENFIPMVKTTYENADCWEANVIPDNKITTFLINNNTEGSLDGSDGITPEAAKVNTIRLTVGKYVIAADGETITGPGDYLMKGTYSQTITIQNGDNVNLTLDGVTSDATTAIKVEGGSPTIIVQGENLFNQHIASFPPPVISLSNQAGITLNGKGTGKLTIFHHINGIQAQNDDAVIGSAKYDNAGNISIKDMTLEIRLNKTTFNGAIIGSGSASEFDTSCGDITISNTNLKVSGDGCSFFGAVIGSGSASEFRTSCGDITISNTDLKVSGTRCSFFGAVIGTGFAQNGGTALCGNITITLSPNKTKKQFLDGLDVKLEFVSDGYLPQKVGYGGFRRGSYSNIGEIIWN